jgi:hypothetical protein
VHAVKLRWMVLALAAAGCVRGAAGTRCANVCRAEADCAEALEVADNDYAGCMESCTELERDPKLAKLVEDHIRCVAAAPTCADKLGCR